MKESPLFSILIANYNNGPYLMDAIDSVRNQSYSNWEIILVDDASTDCSHDLYALLENDTRIQIYFNKRNKGCGYTKRRCIELAHGSVCGFLDPDDVLVNDAIEIMMKEHLDFPDVSMVYSRYYYSDNNLNILGTSEHQCKLPDETSFLLYGKGAISQFAAFKKEHYDRTPGINIHYRRAVDHALYYLLEEVGKIRFVDKPLYYYRFNTGNNISTNSNSDVAFFWDLIVMAEACMRRGLDIEKTIYDKFLQHIYRKESEAYSMGEDHVRMTKTYKTGRIVLMPLKWLK